MKIKSYQIFLESIGSPLLNLQDNIDRDLISIIRKNFEPGSSILEISCGNAADSLYLKELGYNLICTDLNQDYVDNAERINTIRK